jgi:hypothetical protein
LVYHCTHGVFCSAFETHTGGVMEKLNDRLASIKDPRLQEIEIIMANHGMVDASFQQLILLCQTISPALGEVVKSIRTSHSLFLNEIQNVTGKFVSEIEQRRGDVDSLHTRLEASEVEIARLMDVSDLLDKVTLVNVCNKFI